MIKIGLKHLEQIEDLLKKIKKTKMNDSLVRGKIREKLGINDSTLKECLDYLIKNGKVELIKSKKSKFEKYRWIGN